MAQCRVCGNKITNTVSVLINGDQQDFDCLECAKQALVPSCMHCGRLLREKCNDQQHTYYCCEACAEGCEVTANLI